MIQYIDIPEDIDDNQRHYMEERNRVRCNLKVLVAALVAEGKDIEDIADICWSCGFEFATSYYTQEGMLKTE